MLGYKYPQRWSAAQRTQSCTEQNSTEKRLKMLCSRCVLPFLALYMLPEETSPAVLPSRFRDKREINWLDQELFPQLPDRSDQEDLSVGDAGEMDRDVDRRPPHSQTVLAAATEHQYHRKANEKRRKVAPLDSIGSFKMSSSRNRKDEPDTYWEEHEE